MKPKPISSMHRATASGSRSIRTPRASRRTAEPDRLVLERLPCLATAHPAPQATSAAAVEMLNVDGPPPVPAVSTRSFRPASTWAAKRRMVLASPTSSATVSPFALRATRKAPVSTFEVRPPMISSRTAEAWSAVRCVPEQTSSMARVRISLGISQCPFGGPPCARGRPGPSGTVSARMPHSGAYVGVGPSPSRDASWSSSGCAGGLWRDTQEVPEYVLALRREHRLRVELDALGRQLAMPHPHHNAVVRGAEIELIG